MAQREHPPPTATLKSAGISGPPLTRSAPVGISDPAANKARRDFQANRVTAGQCGRSRVFQWINTAPPLPPVMTSSLLLLFNFTGPAPCEICSASRVLGVSVQSESSTGRRFLLWNVRVKTRSSGDLCDVTRGKPVPLSWFVIRPPYVSLRRHQSKNTLKVQQSSKR